jgi:DNA-binding winged helix-turn-helix (wHTH) protein
MGLFFVMHDSFSCRFGPFELNPGRRRLTRDGSTVWPPDRQLDVLLILVARAGLVVPKDTLAPLLRTPARPRRHRQ